MDHAFSARDLILLFGGLFLLWKSSMEIHETIEGGEESTKPMCTLSSAPSCRSCCSTSSSAGFGDYRRRSVRSPVHYDGGGGYRGADDDGAARAIGEFVERHPSVKMLALAFLILVGFTLILESFGMHVPKGYIYFAMFFSMAVECLNLMRSRKNKA